MVLRFHEQNTFLSLALMIWKGIDSCACTERRACNILGRSAVVFPRNLQGSVICDRRISIASSVPEASNFVNCFALAILVGWVDEKSRSPGSRSISDIVFQKLIACRTSKHVFKCHPQQTYFPFILRSHSSTFAANLRPTTSTSSSNDRECGNSTA